MRIKVRRLTLLPLLLLSVLLSGCFGGGDEEDTEFLKERVSLLERTNAELEAKAQEGAVNTQFKSSLFTVQATGQKEFSTINGKINFASDLGIRDTKDDVNNTNVRVGSAFTFTPYNNWSVKVEGSTVHFEHSSKVWGSIKAIKEDYPQETIKPEEMKVSIDTFLRAHGVTSVAFRNIYMSEYHVGYLGRGEITVDNKKYYLNAGMHLYGEYGGIYIFTYEDNQTGVQQELIDLLLKSGKYGDTQLILD